MKKLLILFLATTLFTCNNTKKTQTENTETTTDLVKSQKYKVDVSESTIEWKGSKPLGSHNGEIKFKNGSFEIENNKIKSGSFVVDMNSIVVLDLEGDEKGYLESHLKGLTEDKKDHFFDVGKFPLASFIVTKSIPAANNTLQLTGRLTLKGRAQTINVPVTMSNKNGVVVLESEVFTIDRTRWDVNYGSKSLFDNLGDKFINDDIELKIKIKTLKK